MNELSKVEFSLDGAELAGVAVLVHMHMFESNESASGQHSGGIAVIEVNLLIIGLTFLLPFGFLFPVLGTNMPFIGVFAISLISSYFCLLILSIDGVGIGLIAIAKGSTVLAVNASLA